MLDTTNVVRLNSQTPPNYLELIHRVIHSPGIPLVPRKTVLAFLILLCYNESSMRLTSGGEDFLKVSTLAPKTPQTPKLH
jgi:hypothetical protein